MGKQINHIPQTVMDNLLYYYWLGNFRELENVIERAVILSPEKTLQIPSIENAYENAKIDDQPLFSLAEM